ncbi:hypothetical protein EB093_06190 [bacterium]|nr:hypothetical protein [bacterium]
MPVGFNGNGWKSSNIDGSRSGKPALFLDSVEELEEEPAPKRLRRRLVGSSSNRREVILNGAIVEFALSTFTGLSILLLDSPIDTIGI